MENAFSRSAAALAALMLIFTGPAALCSEVSDLVLPPDATLSDLTDLLATGVEHPLLYQHFQPNLVRVKFDDRCRVRLRGGQPVDVPADEGGAAPAATIAADAGLADALATLSNWGVTWHLSFSLDEAKVEALMNRARLLSPNADLPDLNNYFLLRLPADRTAGTVIQLLRGLPSVQHALFLPQPTPPPGAAEVPDFTDPLLGLAGGYQAYLDPAPFGIDARFAWDGFQGDASGITISNVEYDLIQTHADQPPVTLDGIPRTPANFNLANIRSHGTAVLCVCGGLDNGFGVTGIAKGASFRFATQMRDADTNDPADGIMRSLNGLDPGDVMICEMQGEGPNRPVNPAAGDNTGLTPISFLRDAYDSITISIASRITVCEAAGNGTQNLDNNVYANNSSDRVPGWPVGQGPFQAANDNGSIIVGAGQPLDANGAAVIGLAPVAAGNTGSTVDLQGWGFWVASGGYGDLHNQDGQNFDYTFFSGTSSASPIVASACAIVQRAFINKNGSVATPAQIRSILRNTGTPQVGSPNIGPRPNLRAAIESLADPAALNAAPPVITPPAGVYSDHVLASFQYGDGSQNFNNTRIHYTLDGSEPTLDDYDGTPGFGANQLYIGYSLTLRARAFRFDPDLKRWFAGPVLDVPYTIPDAGQVSKPQFVKINNATGLPAGLLTAGYHEAPLRVFLSVTPPDATLKYRTDGDRFRLFWFKTGTEVANAEVIELGEGSYDLIARGFKPGMDNSELSPTFSVNVVNFGTSTASNVTQLSRPIIFPPGGTFANAATIAIFSQVPGVELRYTLDGSEPTPTSSLYANDPFVIGASATVKARSYRAGYIPSDTINAVFTVVSAPDLNPPTISPTGGNFISFATVTMTPQNPGAVVRYTTNGSEPIATSTLFSAPFNLGVGFHTVKARAFLDNLAPSAVTTVSLAVYDPNSVVRTPVVSPNGGNHTGQTTVQLSTTTQGAAIHYTINVLGDVTQANPLYNPVSGITLQPSVNPQIIRAKAFKAGLVASAQAQTSFNIFTPSGTMENVSFDPPPGTYFNSIQLILSCPTSSATFRTTIDGSDPNTSSTASTRNRSTGSFVSPSLSFAFSHASSGILRASAQRLGFFNSAVTQANYQFVCATPVFTPPPGTFSGSVEIDINTITTGSFVRHTTNGSLPTPTSPNFPSSLTLGVGLHTIQAMVTRNGFASSPVVTGVYNVLPPAPDPEAPSITGPLSDVLAQAGDEVILAVAADGVPEPTYSWTFDGTPMAFFGPEFVLTNVSAADAGTYTVTASNPTGQATSSAIVIVAEPPAPFRILSVSLEANGDVRVTFPTIVGHDYQAEFLDPEPPAAWHEAGPVIAGTGNVEALEVPIPGMPARAILRVRSMERAP